MGYYGDENILSHGFHMLRFSFLQKEMNFRCTIKNVKSSNKNTNKNNKKNYAYIKYNKIFFSLLKVRGS